MTFQELLSAVGIFDRPIFDLEDTATLFEVQRRTIWKWVREGKLQAIKVNGRILGFSREALTSFFEGKAN